MPSPRAQAEGRNLQPNNLPRFVISNRMRLRPELQGLSLSKTCRGAFVPSLSREEISTVIIGSVDSLLRGNDGGGRENDELVFVGITLRSPA